MEATKTKKINKNVYLVCVCVMCVLVQVRSSSPTTKGWSLVSLTTQLRKQPSTQSDGSPT